MKEIKIFCDKCKKELSWGENYYIISIDTHLANQSYSGIQVKEKHYHTNCLNL